MEYLIVLTCQVFSPSSDVRQAMSPTAFCSILVDLFGDVHEWVDAL
ncbi:hypothetical protein ACFTZB_17035 [Rhodococcus sp. NPDC057014]